MERMIPPRDAIEVYVNQNGFVCIKQTCHFEGEKVVMLEPEHVPTIVQWLQECLAEVEEEFEKQTQNE